ncbi:MAG: glycosyltransferase [Acidimicrobiales bacterium]|nr:glycosyltransferase [Acidimicrobiales bacterium]
MSHVVFGPIATLVSVGIMALLLWNLRMVVRPKPATWSDDAPLVSVCVPARDEQDAIAACLTSLCAQGYPNLEILVLDDRSSDDTAAVVRNWADPRVRLLSGDALPAGWTGKNWACHQLSQAATGELLCFIDADTLLEPSAIGDAVGVVADEDAALVSMLLGAEYRSAPEAVLLPMVNHALLALFPVALMHRHPHPRISLAIGPFILVTREAYDESGGHAAAPGHIVDDVELSRAVKATGRQVRLVNGTHLARTRWYRDIGEIWRGFSKNAYGALDYNAALGLAVVCLLLPLLTAPFVAVVSGAFTGHIGTHALVQVGLLLGARTITSVVGRDPLWSIPTHVIAVLFWGATLAWSMVLAATGRTVEWRGRQVAVRSENADPRTGP